MPEVLNKNGQHGSVNPAANPGFFPAPAIWMVAVALDDGRCVDASEAMLRMSGYSREQVIGHSPWEKGLFTGHGQGSPPWTPPEVFKETRETVFHLKDGTERWFLCLIETAEIGGRLCLINTALPLPDHEPKSWVPVRNGRFRPIRSKIMARRRPVPPKSAGVSADQHHEILFNNSSDCICHIDVAKDLRFRFSALNPAAEKTLGLSNTEASGKTIEEVMPADAATRMTADFNRCLEIRKTLRYDEELLLPAGRVNFVTTLFPVSGPEGRINRLIKISRDVSNDLRMEEKLRNSAHSWHGIFEHNLIPQCITTLGEGRFLNINTAFEKMMGLSRKEIIGHTAESLGCWRGAVKRQDILEEITKTGMVKERETVRLHRDGAWRTDLWSGIPIEFLGRQCLLGMVVDITERRKMEAALCQSNEKFGKLFQASPAPITMTSLEDGRYLDVNEAFLQASGLTLKEVLGRNALELGLWRDPDLRADGYERIRSEGQLRDFPITMVMKNQVEKHFVWSAELIDIDGRLCAINVLTDISERVSTEMALRRSEENLNKMIEASPVWIFVTRMDTGVFIKVNEAWVAGLGYSRNEILGRTSLEIGLWACPAKGEKAYETIRKEGRVRNYEATLMAKSGEIREILWSAEPIEINGEKCLLNYQMDITGWNRNVEVLQANEELMSTIFQACPMGLAVTTLEEGRFVKVNDTLLGNLEKTRDELIGLTALEAGIWWDPKYRPVVMERFNRDGFLRQIEETIFTKSGQEKTILRCAEPIAIRDRQYLVSVITDITERKRKERERRQLAAAMEQAMDAMILQDDKGTARFVNGAFERLTGLDSSLVVGRGIDVLKEFFVDKAAFDDLHGSVRARKKWLGTATVLVENDRKMEVEISAAPILDDRADLIGFVSIIRDRTTEILLKEQLIQAQKMEAIGTLASGIAHDFNNILAVILGSIDLMLLGKVDPASREHADRAKKACLRGRELVQQILSTSRKQHTERIEIDPAPVIMETVKFLRATLPSAIDLRTEIQPIPFSIKMDPIELEQILMNLCTNAAHALGKKAGSITVSAGMAESPLKDRPVFVEAAESLSDPALLIEIRDTGGGIPNDVLPRIFEPFFTTKKDAGGTGLGLAVVQGIVRSCGGRILVRSELGQGTSFGIILPAAKKAGQSFTKRTETVSTSQLNVLYVDDQPELVEIAQHYLTHLGHRVIGFTSSVEALSAIKSHPHDFDVLITDNSMPVMNGLDLIKRVKMIKSDLPVILCTGHNPFESQEESENLGITVVLPKPYTFDDLISVATQAVQRS